MNLFQPNQATLVGGPLLARVLVTFSLSVPRDTRSADFSWNRSSLGGHTQDTDSVPYPFWITTVVVIQNDSELRLRSSLDIFWQPTGYTFSLYGILQRGLLALSFLPACIPEGTDSHTGGDWERHHSEFLWWWLVRGQNGRVPRPEGLQQHSPAP